jgi:hypothetical protein
MTDDAESLSEGSVGPVADDEMLLRRIHPTQKKTKEGKPSSAAFKDATMSVDREKLLGDPLEALGNRTGFGLVRLPARVPRELGQEVIADPELLNRAHALVNGRKTQSTANKLRDAAEWIVEPASDESSEPKKDEGSEAPPGLA